MKREIGQERPSFTFDIGKDTTIFAFCPKCKSLVFEGTEKTQLDRDVLKKRVNDHLDFFEGTHELTVVFPKRESDREMDAEEYLSTYAGYTARSNMQYGRYNLKEMRQSRKV